MLSEHFVDICIKLCCSVSPEIKQHKDLFSNIKYVTDWYYREVPEDNRPIEFRDKTDLLKWLATYRCNGGTNDISVINSKLSEGRLKDFSDILMEMKQDISDTEFDESFKLVLNRRKLCEVVKGKSQLQQLLSDIDSCSLIDDEEVLEKWEKQLERAHDSLMQIKKIEMTSSTSSLDLINDDYGQMFQQIMQTVDESNILQTGFSYLKNKLVCGGFENRRLYLIGGSSGVGKSALLINLICNAIKDRTHVRKDSKPVTYLYITAENLIDETWIRFYCCLTGTKHAEFMQTVRKLRIELSFQNENAEESLKKFYNDAKTKLEEILKDRNANVIIKYVPANITTCKDVLSIVDSVASENNLRALFLDYLDLLSTGKQLERRFELEDISVSLKNMGIAYNIPVITVTQLNREGYKPDLEPTLVQMGESMGKVNTADLVVFLQDNNPKLYEENGIVYKVLRMTILKQRGGPQGETSKIYMKSINRSGESIFDFSFQELPNANIDKQKDAILQQNTPLSVNTISKPVMSEPKAVTEMKFIMENQSNCKEGSPQSELEKTPDLFFDFGFSNPNKNKHLNESATNKLENNR